MRGEEKQECLLLASLQCSHMDALAYFGRRGVKDEGVIVHRNQICYSFEKQEIDDLV